MSKHVDPEIEQNLVTFHSKLKEVMEKRPIQVDDEALDYFESGINKLLKHPDVTGKLRLTFQANKPQLQIRMRWVNESHPYANLARLGMMEFTPSINIKYLNRALGREEDQYLLADGGMLTGTVQYYPPDLLEEFADKLEKEAKVVKTGLKAWLKRFYPKG